jgi:transcription elongation GreA/GreB family factor
MRQTRSGTSYLAPSTDSQALDAQIRHARSELQARKREHRAIETRIWELERRLERLQCEARANRNAAIGD